MIESIVKKLFESRVDKLIEESDDLQWDKEWLETASTEDIRSELDNIKSKLDAAKSPAAVKKWEDLYDLYKSELKKRSGRRDESNDLVLFGVQYLDNHDHKIDTTVRASSEAEAKEIMLRNLGRECQRILRIWQL